MLEVLTLAGFQRCVSSACILATGLTIFLILWSANSNVLHLVSLWSVAGLFSGCHHIFLVDLNPRGIGFVKTHGESDSGDMRSTIFCIWTQIHMHALDKSSEGGNMPPVFSRGFATRALSVNRAAFKREGDWKVDLAHSRRSLLAHLTWQAAHVIYSCLKTACWKHTNRNNTHTHTPDIQTAVNRCNIGRINLHKVSDWDPVCMSASSAVGNICRKPSQQLGEEKTERGEPELTLIR